MRCRAVVVVVAVAAVIRLLGCPPRKFAAQSIAVALAGVLPVWTLRSTTNHGELCSAVCAAGVGATGGVVIG
uniref:Putative secreted protein n=1 Tax=Anopheles darlingi TaxID=43151 RepID=A0A2M4D125_ANODA